jgi:hypothetical protein
MSTTTSKSRLLKIESAIRLLLRTIDQRHFHEIKFENRKTGRDTPLINKKS